MQKARRHPSYNSGLRPLVSEQFQVLFHPPVRGTFHLSFTVLVHYRSSLSYLALRDGPRGFRQDSSCPALLRILLSLQKLTCTWLSHRSADFSKSFHFPSITNIAVLQPRQCRNIIGLGYFAFARHYLRNHCCFLFLQVLRCFSSLRLLPLSMGNTPSTYWVAPFGYPRINSRLQIPAAFRSLPRPSSPLEAQASSVRPYVTSSEIVVHIIN